MTPSEQRRADAIADAETLRWFAISLVPKSLPTGRRSYAFLRAVTREVPALVDDLAHADASSLAALAGITEIPTEQFARAAFRAVPALRGGD